MKINNIGEYLYISSFMLTRRDGFHSVCEFKAEYTDVELKKVIGLAGASVKLTHAGDDSFFCGYIDKLTVEKKLTGGTVLFRVVSHSVKSDIDNKNYIFQSTGYKFGDITKQLDVEVKFTSSEVSNIGMPEAIINNGNTDFEFIKKLAQKYLQSVWVDDRCGDKPMLWVGERMEKANSSISLKDYQTYGITSMEGTESIILTTNNYYIFGTEYVIDGKKYVLRRQKCVLEKGIYNFEHIFERCLKPNKPVASNEVYFYEGYVKDNDDPQRLGRIQLEFRDEGIQEFTGDLPWVNYITPYASNSGLYMIPEKGDRIAVIYANNHFIALGSIREKELADGLEPKIKNIGIDDENYIRFSEGAMNIVVKKELTMKTEQLTAEIEKSFGLGSEKVNIKGSSEVNIGDSKVNISGNKINLG